MPNPPPPSNLTPREIDRIRQACPSLQEPWSVSREMIRLMQSKAKIEATNHPQTKAPSSKL